MIKITKAIGRATNEGLPTLEWHIHIPGQPPLADVMLFQHNVLTNLPCKRFVIDLPANDMHLYVTIIKREPPEVVEKLLREMMG